MRNLPGYTITASICESGDFAIYRATHGDKTVLIKVSAAQRPSPSVILQLEHEYEVAHELSSPLIVRPLGLERHAGDLALVMEDVGAEQSLADRLGSPMEVGQFLKVAVGAAAALAEIHRHGLIHKDIKPANLLVDSANNVWITGFGIASRLPRERQAPEPPEIVSGTLAYMAPEQTGRMNRSIDSRSDLYALGVTFYEMLASVLPFTASDPMGWVHCQIAKQAAPLSARVPEIPEPLSNMVMKLLAKTAEERYQTASGLEADLHRCMTACESFGRIDSFPLGEHDVSDRLLIPEKLYGREREIAALLTAFDQMVARGAPELVLVSGYSGIGKSSVVNELHKVLVPPRGLFGAGKFDQFKRDIPYSTLGQAFRGLVRYLLAKSDEEVGRWRDALREALEPNGQLVVDLIPELEHIIGCQPPVPELSPQDARNRFQAVFRRFLAVFAQPAHPLCLFLDDLQWLDSATLELLEHLITEPEVPYILLVGAYRDNEVDFSHPLTRTLDAIKAAAESRVHEIKLAPLALGDVVRLIADTLHCERQRVRPLAELVYEKTGGNPFFAIQFLTMLADERLVVFDPSEEAWTWDMVRIRAKRYTDNVVDLMTGKLNRLPNPTRRALEQLACLGNRSTVATLALLYEKPEREIHAALWAAVCAGLVFCLDDSYTFIHDRVQEAAYSLIPENRRASEHLRIGRLLASRMAPEELEEQIFEVVIQFNRAVPLITSPEERERVAELNLIAGKRAKLSTAYASALVYLAVSGELLAEDRWGRQYNLTFAIEFNRAQCEFLTGDMAAADERLLILWRRAGNLVDIAAVACLRLNLYTALDRSDRAVAVGLEFLRRVGIEWSPHPTREEVQREYDRMRRQMGNRSIEDLIDLPKMSDPGWLSTIDVLTSFLAPASFTDENLRDLILCRVANLSLEHGNSDASSFGYVHLADFLATRIGDYDAAFRFGKLSLNLVEEQGLDRFRARVYVCFGRFVLPWKRPLRTSRAFFQRGFDAAMKMGDVTFASYSCNNFITNLLFSGDPLAEIQQEAENRLEFARKARFGLVIDIITTQLQLIRSLRGLTQEFTSFNDADFDEIRFEEQLEANPRLAIAACWYWLRKLQALFYAGDYTAATAAESKTEGLLWTSRAHLETAEFHFYAALSRAALFNAATFDEQPGHLDALVAHYQQLKVWAESCRENFESRAVLVAAEIARIEGRELDAQRLYEQAMRSAKENDFVQIEALANELAAKFYAAREFETIAHAYMQEARYCYVRWGADGKVKQLEECHPWLVENKPAEPATIAAPPERLDLLTVVKAQHAISGEIVIERLAQTLLQIALENAGAQKGYLFVEPDVELLAVVSPGQSDDKAIEFSRAQPSPHSGVCPSILNYVKRTRETVILDDATANPGEFFNDEYLVRTKAKSVLCMPIVSRAKLIGILYLENNGVAGVFTSARRAVLEMLASQAAISLETAKLYSELQRSQTDLQNQTRVLESILNSMGDGVIVVDEHGEFMLFNPAAQEIFEIGATEGGPQSWAQLYGLYLPDQVTPYPNEELPLTKAIRGEAVNDLEVFVRHPRRPKGLWLRVTARPLIDKAGAAYGGVAVFADTTLRREAEQNLRVAKEAAEAANHTKDQFLAMLSHELRTPLTPVLGGLNALEEDAKGESRDTLAMMRRNLMLETRLIDDLLDVTRVAKGKIDVELEPLDAHQVIRDAWETYRLQMANRQVTLALDAAESFVNADPGRLQQVVANLLQNADRFTTSGGRIEIRTSNPTPGKFRIVCRDDGAGIEPGDLARIFKAFEQAGRSVKRGYGGLGLGLAICKALVEAQGGTITAWSAGHDAGATFEVTLNSVSVAVAEPSAQGSVPVGSSPPQISKSGPDPLRILLVEDHADTREMLARLLTRFGYRVDTAADAQAARNQAEGGKFDMVISDIGLPDGSGLELIHTLHERQSIPAISLSGFGTKSDFQRSRDAGFSEHLVKPIDFNLLKEAIERLRAA